MTTNVEVFRRMDEADRTVSENLIFEILLCLN